MDPEKTVEIFAAGAPDEPEIDADEEEDEDLETAENDDPPDSSVGPPVEVEQDRH